MKSATKGTLSGCFIWFIVFSLLSICLVPVSMAAGMMTSINGFAVKTTGGFICPDGTSADTYLYATTTTDENGNSQPTNVYVLKCVNANGETVKEDPVLYAFIWVGMIAGIGLILAGILAFAFAAPASVLITRFFNRNKSANNIINIE